MKQLLFILFFPSLLFAQTDSTDIIVQNIMKQQKIVGLSLARIKWWRSRLVIGRDRVRYAELQGCALRYYESAGRRLAIH